MEYTIMRRVAYFFYSFIPVLIALGIEFIASFFIMGISVFFMACKGSLQQEQIMALTADVNFNAALSITFSSLVIALFGLWYYYRFEGEYLPKASQTFHCPTFVSIVLLVPATQILCDLIVSIMAAIQPVWLENYEKLMETAGMDENIGITMLLYSVIFAPIGEELIFRGVTLRAAQRALPFWMANIFQALMFGCFHMNMIQGSYAFAAGLILGIICEKCGSIYYAIFFHIIFNFFGSVIGDRLSNALSNSPHGVAISIVYYILAIVIGIIGIFLLRKGISWRQSKGAYCQPHKVMESHQ